MNTMWTVNLISCVTFQTKLCCLVLILGLSWFKSSLLCWIKIKVNMPKSNKVLLSTFRNWRFQEIGFKKGDWGWNSFHIGGVVIEVKLFWNIKKKQLWYITFPTNALYKLLPLFTPDELFQLLFYRSSQKLQKSYILSLCQFQTVIPDIK